MSALLAISLVSAAALAQADAGVPRLDASPHNFFGPDGHPASAELDLCQLCHVPSTLSSAPRPPPAWNRDAAGRPTPLDVRADPVGPPLALRWAGSTLRCLTCHDATVSSIAIAHRSASGTLKDDPVAATDAYRGGQSGPALFRPQWWTGPIMGNHPVSVPYPLMGKSAAYKGFTARAVPIDPEEWVADPRARGLKLVSDTSGFDVLTGTAGVECVSCHDPHGTGNTYFLRLPKERSELCLGCHRK